MILKEKFRNLFKDHFYKSLEEKLLLDSVDDDLEKIADDYAVDFSNWLFNINKEVLSKQLKEFKKEKGL